MRGRILGSGGRPTRLMTAFVVGGVMAAGTSPAWAQDAPAWAQDAPGGTGAAGGPEIKAFVGLFSPLSSLAEQGDTLQAELSTAAAFGGEITYWLPGGLGIAGMVTYSSPEVTSQDLSSGVPVPVSFGNADVLFFGGSLVYRPNLSGAASIVRPVFGVGAGARRVTFPTDPGLSFENATSVAGIIMGGADVTLNDRVVFSLAVRDYVSSFDDPVLDSSKRQHDMVLSAGFAVRLN